jgi:hypothetical protein
MKRGHTLRHEYLSPHDLQCFEDAVARLNGGNRFKLVPTKDVWQQNERERASSNILQIPIAPSLTQQTQTKINRWGWLSIRLQHSKQTHNNQPKIHTQMIFKS